MSSVSGSPVVSLVAALPLDIAADARLLLHRNRIAQEHRRGRGKDVSSRYRHGIPRSTVVELSTIDERSTSIEEKQIRRTCGLEGFGDVLLLVEEIRECVPGLLRLLRLIPCGSSSGNAIAEGRRNAGILVPSGNIVEGVADIAEPQYSEVAGSLGGWMVR
jgi:hypothetical protein